MKCKLNIPILTLFILAMVVGYHSPIPPSAQAFSTEVEESLLSAETETDLVEPLKIPPTSVTIIGPTSGTINTTYYFSALVSPDNVTRPFTHNWQADGQAPITQEGGGIDAVTYSWNQPGTYIIRLNTSNNDGSASTVHEVTITEPSSPLSIRITPSLITTETGGSVGATLNLFNANATPMVINLSSSGGTVQDLPETVTIEANSEQDFPFTITVPNQPGTSRISVVATAQDDPNIRDEALIFVEVPISGISFGSQVLLERRGENNHSGATVCVGNNCTTTSDEGFYRLENAPASGTVVVSHPGYLSASYRYSFGEGGPPFIPVIELLGGDINASGTIDIDDAVLVGLALNSRPGDAHWNATADITDDGIVDQRDMDAVRFNWGETAR